MNDSEVKQSADARIIEYLEAVLEAAKLGQIRTYSISESRGSTPYIGSQPVEVTLSAYLGSKTINLKSELLVQEPQKLYAFWKYSEYPYVLGGPIERFTADGLVYISSYQGSFRPVLILPLQDGLKIQERLSDLREAYKTAQVVLHRNGLAKLREEFPMLKGVFGRLTVFL